MAVSILGALIIILYYIAVVSVGVWSGRKVHGVQSYPSGKRKDTQNHDDNDYLVRLFLASRSVPLVLGVVSMTATWFGGAFLNTTAETVFTNGIVWCQAPFGYALSLIVGRSTAGGIVRETTAVLWDVLNPLYMRFPQTIGEWKRIAAEMEEFWNFPNCLGSIDGKHVVIECPMNSGSRNLNYKKTFSVVFLAVCDAHYRFTYIDMGHYGGEGDSGMFLRSRLLKCLNGRLFGIPPPANVGTVGPIPYVMVGDEAFPLKTFMMRPYPQRELQKHRSNPAQRAEYLQRATFNYRLSRARRLIENAFGIMSSRWRILRRAFRASETTTENIVRACVVLHNFLLQESPHSRLTYNPPGYVDHEDWEGRCMEGGWRDHNDDPSILREPSASGCHSARSAIDIRDKLAKFFMNEGQVPWQEAIVTRAGQQSVGFLVGLEDKHKQGMGWKSWEEAHMQQYGQLGFTCWRREMDGVVGGTAEQLLLFGACEVL
ncbi:hypothetical protein MTO96_043896 [Rhipicephalus appendiculatus]